MAKKGPPPLKLPKPKTQKGPRKVGKPRTMPKRPPRVGKY